MHTRELCFTEIDTLSLNDLALAGRAWIDDGESRGLSRTTLANRRGLVDRLTVYLQREHLDRCGRQELRAYLADVRRRGGKPATVVTYFDDLRTWFRFIAEERMLPVCPFDGMRRPIHREDQIAPFTPEQLQALFAANRHGCHPTRGEAMLLLLLDTGCRSSELCGIRRKDVDLTSRRLCVLGKGGKTRNLPFGRRTARSLWTYLQSNPREPDEPLITSLCGHTPGEALTRSGILAFVRTTGRRAGIQAVRCSPHTFRHTFAIEFLRAGGNVFALKEILGHTSLRMVNRYLNLAEADIAAQHRAFSPADRLPKGTG